MMRCPDRRIPVLGTILNMPWIGSVSFKVNFPLITFLNFSVPGWDGWRPVQADDLSAGRRKTEICGSRTRSHDINIVLNSLESCGNVAEVDDEEEEYEDQVIIDEA